MKATRRAIDILLMERPSLATVIDELVPNVERVSTDRRLVSLAQQRDGVATLLDIAGFRPDQAIATDTSWLDDNRHTFLPSTTTSAALEDPMVEHDRGTFAGWAPEKSDKLGVSSFTNGNGKNLHIMNVNRWSIETALGVDLIYYHVQRRSFALLQYKRMTAEGGEWIYRPDEHFARQQKRMRSVDQACAAGDHDEFRLNYAPSFFKLCKLESLDVDSLSMIPGMYLTREQADNHLAGPNARGPRNGLYFSYENVKSYLTGSLFTDLVAHGLIGTSGGSSRLLREAIAASLNQRGTAVVGILDDERGRRPGWKEDAVAIHRS
ncbi:hypothetical protein EV648_111211 [Kribbella sp. VKM Ac-2568]|nr:hypothetical protein EV648_111211 [Kribbella sp. VKM Ac-2568]